jgi:hypothetical protein
MSQTINFNSRELRHPIRNHITPDAILHTLGDSPRKKAVETLKAMGIHEDYIDDALEGRPYGAKVIDLAEYRWMRLFDEL